MAVAQRKEEYVYAPSRVYSHSRSSVAFAAEPQKVEHGAGTATPAPEVAPIRRERTEMPTRIKREESIAVKRRRLFLPKAACVVSAVIASALVLGMLVRYCLIANAYSEVNELRAGINELQSNIGELSVELLNAVSIDEAYAAAAAAGMDYPNASQIVVVGADKD